jgi:hypothetical protein
VLVSGIRLPFRRDARAMRQGHRAVVRSCRSALGLGLGRFRASLPAIARAGKQTAIDQRERLAE